MITVHIINIRSFSVQDTDNVSPFRLEKSLRLRKEADRLLSLAASKALDSALIPYGLREKDMVYALTEKGRPYFENSPLRFSLSHSGFYACAAACKNDIGIDVQAVIPCDMKVAARCFSGTEIKALEQSTCPDMDFTRIWAMRESAAKLHGTGLAGMKDDISGLCIQTFELENAYLAVCTCGKESVTLCQNA